VKVKIGTVFLHRQEDILVVVESTEEGSRGGSDVVSFRYVVSDHYPFGGVDWGYTFRMLEAWDVVAW
jgi:hypothetical protein